MSASINNALPVGWAVARLPDLIGDGGLLTDGDWVESKDQDPDGAVRLTQLADVGDGFFRDRSNRFMTDEKARLLNCTFLESGDILVARMPDPLGRACVVPAISQPCVTVVDVCVLRPASDSVDTHWLMNFINAPDYRIAVSGLQAGSTRKRISKKNLCTIDLPVPPAAEQQRIVEAIDSYFTRLDDAVATLERVERNLKRYRASVLKSAVEGRLVPTEAALARQEGRTYEPASVLLERILSERRRRWSQSGKKGKYQEPTPPNTTNLPKLPEGWCWAAAESLCQAVDSGATPSKEYFSMAEEGVPFIKVYNLNFDGSLNFSKNPTFVSAEYERDNMARSRSEPGDILINIVGPPLGKVSIVPQTHPFWNINQAIVRFRPLPGLVGEYLSLFLQSDHCKRWLNATTKTTTSQVNLATTTCRRIPVPVPPLVEQKLIVNRINECVTAMTVASAQAGTSVRRAKRLRQSILKWAFEGKLADQDPTDEPASVLLARIKAERDPEKTPKKAAPPRKAAAKKRA